MTTTKDNNSTDPSDEERARVEALPDGSGTDTHDGDDQQDVASGGPPKK